MCDFLAVCLHENYQFSEAYVEKIKSQTQSIGTGERLETHFFHDQHTALRYSAHKSEQDQPFHFGEGRYTLMLHGEIYNIEELSKSLGHQDNATEMTSTLDIVASLFLTKGVESFAHLRGKFSIIVWDSVEKQMYGARDRFGIKPLYYLETDAKVMFATDKKSMMFSIQEEKIDCEALQHYLSYQYIPEPRTLTAGIRKVEPGHYFVKELNKPIEFKRYFHATFHPIITDKQKMMIQIRKALTNSIHAHIQSDCSTGAFLSSGIDSSINVALAKEINPNLKTFSVGFEEVGYSEIDFAQRTAAQLGVENIAHQITAEQYVAHLPNIMWNLDDPLADPACVPLYFAACIARKHVDAVLSGEGADELFGGYRIYREADALKVFRLFPKKLNKILQRLAAFFPERLKGRSFIMRGTTPLKERYIGNAKMFEESEKEEVLKSFDKRIMYQQVTEKYYRNVREEPDVHQMQYIDLHTWLPGDILLKANKMTKAHSLKLRVPFLDREVFDVAKNIPVHEKIANGTTKSILREAFAGVVPNDVLYREKLGFPVPIRHWLKNELYGWAKNLIRESDTEHFIDKNAVCNLLDRHARNKGDYSRRIWTVLMFMMWHRIHIEKAYAELQTST